MEYMYIDLWVRDIKSGKLEGTYPLLQLVKYAPTLFGFSSTSFGPRDFDRLLTGINNAFNRQSSRVDLSKFETSCQANH